MAASSVAASAAALAAPALPTGVSQPLLRDKDRDSHWNWYAVDVKKKAADLAFKLDPEDVRRIRKELRNGNPVPLRDGSIEARIVKLQEMQQVGAPGWWDDTAPGKKSPYFTEEEVVVQQRTVEKDGKRPWRLIVRVPAGDMLDQQLLKGTNGKWTTDVLVMFSGPAALLDVGACIGNDDLPVRFTGAGGVAEDFLMHTTPYQRFDDCKAYTTIPESVFEVRDAKAYKLCEAGSLKEEFYFDDRGTVRPAQNNGYLESYYYARIVSKAWWQSVLCKALGWALLVAVDQYNNVSFFWSTRELTAMSWAFLMAAACFGLLECYFSWLLACRDMEENVHKDDMALADTESWWGNLFIGQTLLHFFQVPTAVKDIVIWTCPRGGNMGRAVAKVAGARVHVLTWPTKNHYQCDLILGQHKIYPLLLVKNLVLVALQGVIIVGSGKEFVFVLPYFLPKILIVCLTAHFFTQAVQKRDLLRCWLIGKWNQEDSDAHVIPDTPPKDKSKLMSLYNGVYKKHFYDAPNRDLWNYHWFHLDVLLPTHTHSDRRRMPEVMFGGAISLVMFACVMAKLGEELNIEWK